MTSVEGDDGLPRPTLDKVLAEVAAGLLAPTETLAGSCLAIYDKFSSKGLLALLVTDQRLVIQEIDAKLLPVKLIAESISISPEQISQVRVGHEGFGLGEPAGTLVDGSIDLSVRVSTTHYGKLKLKIMRGKDSVLGKIDAGAIQGDGTRALGEWFARNGVAVKRARTSL